MAIRNKITGDGAFDFDERSIPLKIAPDKSKDVLGVSEKLLNDIKNRKDELGLKYNVYTMSRNGRFLNLPRTSGKKLNVKTENEKTRLNKKLKEVQKRKK